MKRIIITSFALLFGVISQLNVSACTNFLITKGASADGSTMISYAADSHVLFGELYHWPAKDYKAGEMLKVYEWDTGKYLGEIPQTEHTYSVVGNMNEFQLAIGETTYTGRKEVSTQKGAIMDYGSLIYITLQRAKTAREAIKVMTDLVAKYGYASTGESFSIADKDEVWIMELIGKGEGKKGAVWVALKIPDGYVSGHANQARITTFPLNDPDNCIYADDVISFAKEKGWFKGKDKEFSFSDTYAPVDFGGARFCEGRVWSMFRKVNKNMEQYAGYASGHDLTKRMPLWIKPDHKVSVNEMMDFMRDHFEGTDLDMSKDIGAGPFANPYRWRPLTWKVDEKSYCNERAVATQQTGFSFITQSRSWLPDAIGGINWFSVDDAASTVYVPIYCGITKIPETYAVGNGDMTTFSETSAFWTYNQVSNLAYTRYNLIHPEIDKKQKQLEKESITYVKAIDMAAAELYKTNKDMAIDYITDFSVNRADKTTMIWKEFYKYLFVKYSDGNIKEKAEPKEGYLYVTPKLTQPGYGDATYKKIVKETGEHFLMPSGGGH